MTADNLPNARTGSSPPFDEAVVLPRGTTVGRYVILDVIGHGGMGVVYSAIDTQLGRKLAIKFVLDDRHRKAPLNASRLLREAHALARLSHRNVVTIYDVGTYEDRVFLVMEYVEGQTLAAWLATNPPWKARLALLFAAGEGLAAAHEAAVIHRDFKPDNVLIGTDGRVVVMDFGLAREADSEDDLMADDEQASLPPPSLRPTASPSAPLASNGVDPMGVLRDSTATHSFAAPLTVAGKILGTVGFMAPEQAYGRATSVATDQFSYCVTVYFALSGRLPFEGETVRAYLRSIYRTKLQPPEGSKVPLRVWKILAKGMSRKSNDRYPSMRELLAALRDDRRKTYWGWAAATSGALAVAALTAVGSRLVHDRQNVCAADPKEWSGIWDDTTKADARNTFATTDPANGAFTFDSASRPIDAYVSQWNGMRGEACRSARIEHRQPEAVYKLRSECLARRKMQLESVTRLMRRADKGVVGKGLSLAYGLDLISWCADVDALRASAGLPDDPKKRALVLDVQAKLADAQAKFTAGKLDDALGLAADAVTLARSTDHAQTTAEALLTEADLMVDSDREGVAVPALREAYFLASGAGADALVVGASARLAGVVGNDPQKVEEADSWLSRSRASLKRLGGSEELELAVANAESTVFTIAHRQPELGQVPMEKNLTGCRKLYGAHRKTLEALFNLGTQQVWLGDPGHARPLFEEAEGIAELIGGASWPELGIVRARLGWTLISLGEFEKGEATVRLGLEVLERFAMEYREADAFQSLAWLSLVRGDAPAAMVAARAAIVHHTRGDSSAVDASSGNVALGLALTRAGRPAEALPLCDKALAALEDAKLIYSEKPFGWDALRCQAEALIALGRSPEAIANLQRSLTLHRRMLPGDYARAEFALARALSNSHRDTAHAIELASAAREELSRYPFLVFELHEVDAWIAKRSKPG